VVLFQTLAYFNPLLAFIFGYWPIICNLTFMVLPMPILAHNWLSCKAHSWLILAKAADVQKLPMLPIPASLPPTSHHLGLRRRLRSKLKISQVPTLSLRGNVRE
jgi:hypothetical protein